MRYGMAASAPNRRLVEAAPDFYDALVGDDPELPENLRPIAWARGLLNDYREMLGRYWHPDPLSAWEHLDRVRQMLDRLEAALAKAEGRAVGH